MLQTIKGMGRIGKILPLVFITALVIYCLGYIPEVPVLFLWAMLFIVVSVFVVAFGNSGQESSGRNQLKKGVSAVLMIWGVLCLVGASYGNRNLVEPLPQLAIFLNPSKFSGSELDSVKYSSPFKMVGSQEEFNEFLATAKLASKSVVMDFYADWCLDCKRLDATTLKDPSVVEYLENNFVSLKIDVTDPNSEFGRAMRKRFKVFGPPALVFLDSQGNFLQNRVTYGYLNVEEILDLLSQV